MKITEAEAREILNDPIYEHIVDYQEGWLISSAVFERGGRLYRFLFSEGPPPNRSSRFNGTLVDGPVGTVSVSAQDDGADVECHEVESYQVTVPRYRPVATVSTGA